MGPFRRLRKAARPRFERRTGVGALAWLLLLGAGTPVAAQDERPWAEREGGLSVGYYSMVQELRSLRRIRRDTTLARPGTPEGELFRLEIDGLVVDETQTKLGRDFYDVFYSIWQAPQGAFNFTVTVTEQPLPSLGTRVLVRVNDEIAFQAALQPRYDLTETLARQAVFYAQRLLQNQSASIPAY